jgi:hypothetical protein
MLSQVPGTSPPRVRLCDRVRVTPLPRRLRRLTCNIWLERGRVRVGDGARQDNGPDPFGHQPFQRALCNNSCISWRHPFGCYLARGRAKTTHFPRYSHDKADPPQTMNACLMDSKEAAPCLGQGKPAQKLAPFAGHQKSRTLAAAPVEEPNQPSSRRIGDRIWVDGLSVSRGY